MIINNGFNWIGPQKCFRKKIFCIKSTSSNVNFRQVSALEPVMDHWSPKLFQLKDRFWTKDITIWFVNTVYNYFTVKTQRKNKSFSSPLFSFKRWQTRIQIFGCREGQTLFCYYITRSTLKITLAECWDSWLTTFFGNVWRKGVSTFQWGPTVHTLFLYSDDADFIQSLLQRKEKMLAQSFGFTFC